MATSRTGTPSIIKLAREISKLYGTYGAWNLEASTNPAFKLAVVALVAAVAVFEAADDHPAEVDDTFPRGPEDPA
jgi:hypothetical protein